MKFGRKRRGGVTDKHRGNEQARRKIWEDPGIIEEMFSDEAWSSFDGEESDTAVPSEKMSAHIDDEISQEEARVRKREVKSIRFNQVLQGGIAAALLLFISFNIWQYGTESEKMRYAQEATFVTDSVANLWVAITNDTEEVDTLLLPDQSTVHLFAHSEIRYLSDFSAAARDIQLSGKAYFSVAKDASRPFSVYARGTKTTALGTSFTVDARPDATRTGVELHSGKVLVASTADQPTFENTFLDKPGAKLLLDEEMHLINVEKPAKSKAALAEKVVKPAQDLLEFENVPLPEVFDKLQERYAVHIQLEDPEIANIHYTASIQADTEKLADIMTLIALINNLRYEVGEDGTYHIYKQATQIEEK